MNTPRFFDKVLGSLMGFALGDLMGSRNSSHPSLENTDMMLSVARAYLFSILNADSQNPPNFEQTCCEYFNLWYSSDSGWSHSRLIEHIATCFGKAAQDWKVYAHSTSTDDSLGFVRCVFPVLLDDLLSAISQAELTNSDTTAIDPFYKVLQRYLYSTQTKSTQGRPQLILPTEEQLNVFSNSVYHSMCDNFESAILSALDNKEPSVTIALTGALAGARWGYNNIPRAWVDTMDVNLYNEIRVFAEEAMKIIQNQEE